MATNGTLASIFRSDCRRDHLVRLKLDCQVDLFLDQVIGGPQRDFRLISVVHAKQFHRFAFRCPNQTQPHFAIESLRDR